MRPRASVELRQHVEVGLDELVELAPALDLRDDRVLVADRLQHARVGREAGLAAALLRQPELVEEDLAELLRRADHELRRRRASQISRSSVATSSRTRASTSSRRSTFSRTPSTSIVAQHAHERQLDLVHQPRQAALVDLLALPRGERRASAAPRRRPGPRRRPPARAPRTARGTGTRAARARAGRRRAACRGRGCAGTAPSALASWAMTGRVAERGTTLLGRSRVADQHLVAGRDARTRQVSRSANSSPSGGSGARTATATSASPGSAATSASVPSRTRADSVCSAAGAGAAASPSPSASSSRRSGSRSSNSRKTSRSLERSGSPASSAIGSTSTGTSRWIVASCLRDPRVVGVLGQVLLALGARDLVDCGEHRSRGRRTAAGARTPSCRRCPGRRGCCPTCRP